LDETAHSLIGVLLCEMKRGGGVTGTGCGVELGAAHPWQGGTRRLRKAGGSLLQCGRRKKGRLGQVGRKAKQAGWVAGPNLEENIFLE
jgi:hypothetical protein